jgi:hypothetical protein
MLRRLYHREHASRRSRPRPPTAGGPGRATRPRRPGSPSRTCFHWGISHSPACCRASLDDGVLIGRGSSRPSCGQRVAAPSAAAALRPATADEWAAITIGASLWTCQASCGTCAAGKTFPHVHCGRPRNWRARPDGGWNRKGAGPHLETFPDDALPRVVTWIDFRLIF